MLDWDNLWTEILAACTIAVLGSFILWLKKSYERFKSIDESMKKIPKVINDHEYRLVRIERHLEFPEDEPPALDL